MRWAKRAESCSVSDWAEARISMGNPQRVLAELAVQKPNCAVQVYWRCTETEDYSDPHVQASKDHTGGDEMSGSELTALLLFCAAMSFSPGPNTTLSTALAANHGLKRALRFCLAVPTGWTLLMLACGLGLGALVTGVPALRWAVKLAGVSYMLWLAWRLAGSGQLAQADARRLELSFAQGVGLQFLNIKAWMLALTLTAGWVVNAGGQPAPNPGQRLAIICALMVFFAFSSNFAYAVTGSLLRQWLSHGSRLLWFNRALALVLLATAVWMVTV
jgi:threonine/homoserine/homoserine lactone efflux protein